MRVVTGKLDYGRPWSLPDVYLFTGNPAITGRGKLVMGRGAARDVRDTYPGVDLLLAQVMPTIVSTGNHLAWVTLAKRQVLGWFQVKHHWNEPADLQLIRHSATELHALATLHSDRVFHLNAPGIGNGRLAWGDVRQVLEALPDNVRVYVV